MRLGITQRVADVPGRAERRDVLDQAWAPFLAACDVDMIVVPNRLDDPAGYLERLGASGVVLSGGNNISSALGTRRGVPARVPDAARDLAPERDQTETALLRASIDNGWPVIGVCRGMQVMNVFHGGAISPLTGHAGTRHPLVAAHHEYHGDAEVNSFHDYGIPLNGLAEGFTVLATSNDWAEAFMHRQLAHLGVMWHPERNHPVSSNDLTLFRQFFRRRS